MEIRSIDGRLLWSGDADTIAMAMSLAIASYVDLSPANLHAVNLSYADLHAVNLSYANLRYANLRSVDLSSVDLRYANLSFADLRNANLSFADLRFANLHAANFRYANISSVMWPSHAVVLRAPIAVLGCRWPVLICGSHMHRGCDVHPMREWETFSDEQIMKMDADGLDDWHANKAALLEFRDREAEEQFAAQEDAKLVTT